jgi:hypothetical protein
VSYMCVGQPKIYTLLWKYSIFKVHTPVENLKILKSCRTKVGCDTHVQLLRPQGFSVKKNRTSPNFVPNWFKNQYYSNQFKRSSEFSSDLLIALNTKLLSDSMGYLYRFKRRMITPFFKKFVKKRLSKSSKIRSRFSKNSKKHTNILNNGVLMKLKWTPNNFTKCCSFSFRCMPWCGN